MNIVTGVQGRRSGPDGSFTEVTLSVRAREEVAQDFS